MRLIKVFANKSFKTIRFNHGFNVILGEPKERLNSKKDTHNLGKSLLITVLDFLLLKKVDKKHILKKQPQLHNYTFYLEVQLNSSKYLIIQRNISKSSKISLRICSEELQDIEEISDWDYEMIPLKEARSILNNAINLDIAPNWSYRKSISYFLRTQNDFQDVFQLSKFNKGKDQSWKPFLFELLGFPGELIQKKCDLDEKKEELKTLIKKIKENLGLNSGESDKLKGIIQFKINEKNEITKTIDAFHFYDQDKEINQELVEEIDSQINTLNTIRYNATEELKRIQDSLSINVPRIDLKELEEIYQEVEVYFPKNLVKEYEDLQTFVYEVSEERKKYMTERKTELQSELSTLDAELSALDNRKSILLSVIKDKNSYQKFKHYQKELAKTESEIGRFEEKLKNLGHVDELEKKVSKLTDEIKTQIDIIKTTINLSNQYYIEIRQIFANIIRDVLNVPAIISIVPNKKGNIEFHADIQNPKDMKFTAEAHGTTYRKMLCMAFDLAVLIAYSKHSFYKFVYHDGALEGLDDRKKINFITKVREICKQYDLQYILTVIDSDIPQDAFGNSVPFSKEDIILTLHDRDESGLLFERSF